MVTAIDTSILLDLLCGDNQAADAAESVLAECAQKGGLIVCETVVAELRPALDERALVEFFGDWKIDFVPGSLKAGLLAGSLFEAYLKRRGSANRVVADFLIGAHAAVFAKRLCARDRGYWRDYFKNLEIVTP